MTVFNLVVPGYVAIPSRGGPDVFQNTLGPFDDNPAGGSSEFLHWTDQGGHRSGTDVQFWGRSMLVMDFHFPFTTPLVFGTTTLDVATRMRLSAVFMTFFLPAQIPPSDARVNRIRVFDRLTTAFDTRPLLGLLGMPDSNRGESETAFMNSTVSGRNLHGFAPLTISKGIGVTVTVDFGAGGGLIGFTGAGVLLES